MEKAILFGVKFDNGRDFEHSLEELSGLAKACDFEVAGVLTQTLDHPDSATYLGKGKVSELKDYVDALEAQYVLCEGDLSPSQMQNLQEVLKVPVWDHTNIILEIFSRRAKTKEAKLQVELAYLQFMLPRLTGMWQHLGRQGGGGGSRANKGEGEKQIELDRRDINHQIAQIRSELEKVTTTRAVQRSKRQQNELPKVALVGYTNAGKSSLLNSLINENSEEKKVFEKDMLFATLDTSIRKVKGAKGRDFLISDTVGFIENLPHSLIKAFRSTLEEVKYADLLLVVIDSSDENWRMHKKVTEDTLRELSAMDIPKIYVLNKSDLLRQNGGDAENIVYFNTTDMIQVSVKTGQGMDVLLNAIDEQIFKKNKKISLLLPFKEAKLLDEIHRFGDIFVEEYRPEGIYIEAEVPEFIPIDEELML